MADCEDNICSPECLVSMEPVTDPYASDEDRRKFRRIDRKFNLQNNEVKSPRFRDKIDFILSDKTNCYDWKPEQVYLYFSIEYKEIPQEINLDDKSVEECLEKIFEFCTAKEFDRKNSSWKGKTMKEIITRKRKFSSYYSWFEENDNVDWKSSLNEQKESIDVLHSKLGQAHNDLQLGNQGFFIHNLSVSLKAKQIYTNICLSNVKKKMSEDNIYKHHSIVRSYVSAVANLIAPQNFQEHGLCMGDFNFYIPHQDCVSDDDPPLIGSGRRITVRVCPDAVFTCTQLARDGKTSYDKWLAAIQIYVPTSEVQSYQLSNAEKCTSGPSSQVEYISKLKATAEELKASTVEDKLVISGSVRRARGYIEKSVPIHCRSDYNCINKIAGDHVIQLLCVAMEMTKDQPYKKGLLRVWGVFIVNEHIYFSGLDIDWESLPYLKGSMYCPSDLPASNIWISKNYHSFKSPVVSYSNWRLDITKANHRLAFVTFLDEYLYSYKGKP